MHKTERESTEIEQEFTLTQRRLEVLVKLNNMVDAPQEEIAGLVIEEMVKLTNSKSGWLGRVNQDETEVELFYLSKSAEVSCHMQNKPKSLPVNVAGLWAEAIRQRKAIITNDYYNEITHKKGVPEGHISLKSILTIPIFDGSRLVMVAVVANKCNSYNELDIKQVSLLMNGFWTLMQRKNAEKELIESNKQLQLHQLQLQTIFNGAIIGIVLLDLKTGISLCNKAFEKMLGYSADELRIMNFREYTHPDDLEQELQLYKAAWGSRKDKYQLEKRYIRKDGMIIWGKLSLSIIRDNGDQPEYIVGMVEDITEKKQAEDNLSNSEGKYRNLFENSMDGIIIGNSDGIYDSANPAVCKILGMSEQEICKLGRNGISDLSDPRFHKLLSQRDQTGMCRGEINFIHKSGSKVPVEIASKIYRNTDGKELVGVFVRDMSERLKTQQELTRLDRFNLIGEMSAGIGHEIRNPMTTVRGFLQLLGNKSQYHEEQEFFELMISELDRANEIITEFLSLAKNKPVELKPYCLNRILKNIKPLIFSDAIKSDKEINMNLGDIPEIFLDEKEIRQLILNLVRNGLEAMNPGGTIYLKTYSAGKAVILQVEDCGCGIPQTVIDKLGQPFVTTKEDGTGLGLSVCYSICQRHNAKLDYKTSSEGTTFYVKFPV